MKLKKKSIFLKVLLIFYQNTIKTKKLTINKVTNKLKIKSKMINDNKTALNRSLFNSTQEILSK